ncbi:hypothetical protein [Streptomyces amakusaensis]|uniref:Uncharacterized protein n=1 Tax=Streptomyces amakusaensis TaxID=67271 RepID=A0ABW0AUN7_9ACTN
MAPPRPRWPSWKPGRCRDLATVAAEVRTSLGASIERTRRKFLVLMEPVELDADPAAAASVPRCRPSSRRCRSTASAPSAD